MSEFADFLFGEGTNKALKDYTEGIKIKEYLEKHTPYKKGITKEIQVGKRLILTDEEYIKYQENLKRIQPLLDQKTKEIEALLDSLFPQTKGQVIERDIELLEFQTKVQAMKMRGKFKEKEASQENETPSN